MSRAQQELAQPQHIDAIDVTALYALQRAVARDRSESPRLDYRALMDALAHWRDGKGLPSAVRTIATMAADPDNEQQQKFIAAISSFGISVVPLHAVVRASGT